MDPILLYWLVALSLVVLGVAGLVLPAIPGAPLLFLGLLVAAWTENFMYAGVRTLAILAVLALLTYGVDLWATMFGAKRFGASRRAFIGAVIGELLAQRGIQQAARAGIGATIGLVLGAALKLALAFAMIGIFIVGRFF